MTGIFDSNFYKPACQNEKQRESRAQPLLPNVTQDFSMGEEWMVLDLFSTGQVTYQTLTQLIMYFTS